jgi:hypothetical protein
MPEKAGADLKRWREAAAELTGCSVEEATPELLLEWGRVRRDGWREEPENVACIAAEAETDRLRGENTYLTGKVAKLSADIRLSTERANRWKAGAMELDAELRNVLMLAQKMRRRPVPEAHEHLLRFCKRVGLEPTILRSGKGGEGSDA